MKQTEFSRKITDPSRSAFQNYCDLVVGRPGLLAFLNHEFYHFFLAPMPGALGLLLRRLYLPLLLGGVGKKPAVGRNVTFRHPHKIRIGDDVVIDDNAVLDAKGDGNGGISLGKNAVVGRNTVLSCKGAPPGGSIEIGDNVNIAMNCLIHAEEKVTVGDNVLFAAYVYVVGGGNHDFSDLSIPIIEQPSISRGGVSIGEDCWLAARVTVMDGVTIGRGCVVGANALVRESLPEYAVAAGVPARVIRSRKTG